MGEIRLARQADVDEITTFDHVAQQDSTRVDFIRNSVEAGNCYVFEVESRVVGYGVLEYSFYSHGFVSMLYVHPDFRHRGIGVGLMKHMERACRTTKLFTSTNRSNEPMQVMLERLGYESSGRIENLDPGDPELVYFKLVSSDAR